MNRSPSSFWTTAEVSIGLLAASLPPLGPLIRRAPNPLRLYSIIRKSFTFQFNSQKRKLMRFRSDERLRRADDLKKSKAEHEGHELGVWKDDSPQEPTDIEDFV